VPKHVGGKQCSECVLSLVHGQMVKEAETENYCDYIFLFVHFLFHDLKLPIKLNL